MRDIASQTFTTAGAEERHQQYAANAASTDAGYQQRPPQHADGAQHSACR